MLLLTRPGFVGFFEQGTEMSGVAETTSRNLPDHLV